MKIFLSRDRGAVNVPSITFFKFETTTKEAHSAEILTGHFKTVDAKTRLTIDELRVAMRPSKWIKESFDRHGLTEEVCKTFTPKKVMMRDIFRYMNRNLESLYICHDEYIDFGIKGYFSWIVLKNECLYLDVLQHFKSFFNNCIIDTAESEEEFFKQLKEKK